MSHSPALKKFSKQSSFLTIYAIFYLWGWKLFLEIDELKFLKPYGLIWIISAFICLLISRIKKQQPFLAFLVGSIFGPAGLFMVLFSEKDIRVIDKSEMDKDDYDKIFEKLEGMCSKIICYPNNVFVDSGGIIERLSFYGDFFEIKIRFPWFCYVGGDASPAVDRAILLKAIYNILRAFIKEYSAYFGENHNVAQKKLKELETYLN